MELIEFITNELLAIAESEIRSDFSNESADTLKYKIKKLLKDGEEDDFDPEEILKEIQNDEQLSLLKSFKWHVEIIDGLDGNDQPMDELPSLTSIETEINNFSEVMKSQPDNKLLPLLWIIYKKEYFQLLYPDDKDILSFYETIFEKYSYLIELENFFSFTNLLHKSYLIDKKRGEYFIPLFKKAVERYPEKPALKLSLAGFLYDNQDYNASVEVLKSVCYQIESIGKSHDKGPQDSLFEDDYMNAKQSLAKNYDKLGDTEMVQYYTDQVIKYFHETEVEYISNYIDSFFLRMRINLNKGDYQKVIQDYQIIKPEIESPFLFDIEPSWKADYQDVLKFIERDKRQQN